MKKKYFRKVLIILILLLLSFLSFDNLKNYFVNEEQSSFVQKNNIDLLMLVNKENPIPDDYNPNLIKYENHEINHIIYDDLMEMFASAKKDNVDLNINTAYRSKEEQQDIWDSSIADFVNQGFSLKQAITQTQKTVLEPGYSEHETGLAIDFSKPGAYNVNEQMWSWLNNNAYKYGFILRYPETKKDITKIDYEPWHYRYVGKENSAKITDSGLCLEEYLNRW